MDMDSLVEPGVEEATVSVVTSGLNDGDPQGQDCTDQQCHLKEGDDGEVLLVQDLQDFQGVVVDSVDPSRVQSAGPGGGPGGQYQQYQPVVVQGFVTSSGEVVHVVQQDVPTTGHRTLPQQHQQAQHAVQPQMMHPDLYRLIKMFPDFSTKTLHRIFVMCHCDLKRALDQALFARQFRQLDTASSYSAIAPSARFHPHPSPYRSPAGPAQPYMPQVEVGPDAFLPRGARRVLQQTQQTQSGQPILLYQQADPRLNKTVQSLADADVVEIKIGDHGLSDGLGFVGLEASVEGGLGSDGDSLPCSKNGILTSSSDAKGILGELDGLTLKSKEVMQDEVVTSQATVVC